jgi:hypothetical protein
MMGRLLLLTLLAFSAAVVGFVASAHYSAPAPEEAEAPVSGATATEAVPDCCCAQVSRLSLLTAPAAAAREAAAEPAAVELKAVKLPELLDTIKSHTGKLVLVDLWADY